MNSITRTPLCWPDSVPRTAPHLRGSPQFKPRSLSVAADFVRSEINRLNGRSWNASDYSVIVSSNLKLKNDGSPYSQQIEPVDSGIAVYFTLRILRNGKWFDRPIVMSCDKWRKSTDNLYAIGKDIEAQRARQRWGCTNYEQSFRGYLAIAEKCGGPSWWEVLKIKPDADKSEIELSYRHLAKTMHPDAGGSSELFSQLRESFDQAMAQFI